MEKEKQMEMKIREARCNMECKFTGIGVTRVTKVIGVTRVIGNGHNGENY
jgi:hypothetical protein